MGGEPIGIVAALPEELRGLRHRVTGLRLERVAGRAGCRGSLGGREIVCLVTGAGRLNAAESVTSFLDSFELAGLVGVGVAGALSPSLEPGACVWASEVRSQGAPIGSATADRATNHGGETLQPPDWELRRRAAERQEGAVVVESAEILGSAEAKSRLWHSCGRPEPAVVDLESAAWAGLAAERGLPWLVLRTVSDTAAEDLPLDFNRFRDGAGGVDRGRVARHAALRPWLWSPLAGLARRVRACADRLAAELEEILAA